MDWYNFDAEAGDNVFLDLVERDQLDDMILELFDPQGERIGASNTYARSAANIDVQLQSGGTYSIRVRETSSPTGSYNLSLLKLPPATILKLTSRLRGTACEPLVSRCLIQDTIEFAGQVHRYSFNSNAGDRVFLELVELDDLADMTLALFYPKCERIGSSNPNARFCDPLLFPYRHRCSHHRRTA